MISTPPAPSKSPEPMLCVALSPELDGGDRFVIQIEL
ncbi:hypothetical protein NIES4103_15140 [Nostoc sp. NIES-4103]|nr:hypothetical protein NIES4103_15140 [Nostoc sp. NIES-4103]